MNVLLQFDYESHLLHIPDGYISGIHLMNSSLGCMNKKKTCSKHLMDTSDALTVMLRTLRATAPALL